MKSILPCLTWLTCTAAALCTAAAVTAAAPNVVAEASTPRGDSAASSWPAEAQRITAGDQLLLQALAQLERHDSLAARLEYRASLNGRTLSGGGNYWQQGRGDALRVRLELRVAPDASLLQVSNGRFLWTDQRLPTGKTVTRINLRRLRAEAARDAAKLDELQPGEAAWSPIRPELFSYYGGLPRLLSALSESFTFQPPQAMRFEFESPDKKKENTDLPVFAMVGHWKRARLAAMLPKLDEEADNGADQPIDLAALPPRFPQEVLLLLGQSDLFPYRIEYRQDLQRAPAARDRPAVYQLSDAPLVLVKFSDVSFDLPIGPGQFDYSPGDTPWVDHTAEYLDRLRRQREEQVAARNRQPTL